MQLKYSEVRIVEKIKTSETDKRSLLLLADWDGLRRKVLSGIRKRGRDIPLTVEGGSDAAAMR